jgi:hypothetical protein
MYWYHAHSRLLYQDGVRFVRRWDSGKFLTNVYRGPLYVAPTDDGPYGLITGDEVQIQNVIKTGPIFVSLHDWSHYQSEYRIEEWEKACVFNLSRGHNIYSVVVMSNLCAKMPS